MSVLIDVMVRNSHKFPAKEEYNGRWYVAKPLEIFSVVGRLRDAWRVLIGRSRAYHYKRDMED